MTKRSIAVALVVAQLSLPATARAISDLVDTGAASTVQIVSAEEIAATGAGGRRAGAGAMLELLRLQPGTAVESVGTGTTDAGGKVRLRFGEGSYWQVTRQGGQTVGSGPVYLIDGQVYQPPDAPLAIIEEFRVSSNFIREDLDPAGALRYRDWAAGSGMTWGIGSAAAGDAAGPQPAGGGGIEGLPLHFDFSRIAGLVPGAVVPPGGVASPGIGNAAVWRVDLSVLRGPAGAEYGSTGIPVNVVTRRSTPFWRSGSLTSGGTGAPLPERGGPIVKDRLWLYGGWGGGKANFYLDPGAVNFRPGNAALRFTSTEVPERDFSWESIAPRLGLSYSLGAELKSRLAAGLGGYDKGIGAIPGAAGSWRLAPFDLRMDGYGGTTGAGWKAGWRFEEPPLYKIEDAQIFSSGFYLTGLRGQVAGGFKLAPAVPGGDLFQVAGRSGGTRLFQQYDFRAPISWVAGSSTADLSGFSPGGKAAPGTAAGLDLQLDWEFPLLDLGLGATSTLRSPGTLFEYPREGLPAAGGTWRLPTGGAGYLLNPRFTVPWHEGAGATRIGGEGSGETDARATAVDDYLGSSLTFNKRLANRWMLRGNFTAADWNWEEPHLTQGEREAAGPRVLEPPGKDPEPKPDALPSDGHFHAKGAIRRGLDDQWALRRIGFAPAGRDGKGALWPRQGKPVIVAVVDTGVDFGHPDLHGSCWANLDELPGNGVDDDGNGFVDDFLGWNFVEDSNDTHDDNGHGTFVAGQIGAATDNGIGIAGVNPWARIMPVKVTDFDNRGNSADLAKGIVYAADNGARVINASIGGVPPSGLEQAAVDYAAAKGALVVVAAGNRGVDTAGYSPAGLRGVITVAATGADDRRAPFSNWGGKVDLAAPGVDVLSLRAVQTDFVQFADPEYRRGANVVGRNRHCYHASGTSFSAPFVAGVASLLFSLRPELTADQVRRMVLQSARDIDAPGTDQFTGHGLLDAAAAVAADPEFFVEAAIDGVEVVRREGAVLVRVSGTADADRFAGAQVEIGEGASPRRWKPVAGEIARPVRGGALAEVPAGEFRGAKEWTLRVVTRHANGRTRENRYLLRLG